MVKAQETKKVKVTMGQIEDRTQEHQIEKTAFSEQEQQKKLFNSDKENKESRVTGQKAETTQINLIDLSAQKQGVQKNSEVDNVHPMIPGMMYPYPNYGNLIIK